MFVALIEALIRHASQPRFVYSYRWHRGNLVMWDNRAVPHTAGLFNLGKSQRLIYRTTVYIARPSPAPQQG